MFKPAGVAQPWNSNWPAVLQPWMHIVLQSCLWYLLSESIERWPKKLSRSLVSHRSQHRISEICEFWSGGLYLRDVKKRRVETYAGGVTRFDVGSDKICFFGQLGLLGFPRNLIWATWGSEYRCELYNLISSSEIKCFKFLVVLAWELIQTTLKMSPGFRSHLFGGVVECAENDLNKELLWRSVHSRGC